MWLPRCGRAGTPPTIAHCAGLVVLVGLIRPAPSSTHAVANGIVYLVLSGEYCCFLWINNSERGCPEYFRFLFR